MDSKKLNIIESYIEYLLLKQIKKDKKCNKWLIIDLMQKYMIKFF